MGFFQGNASGSVNEQVIVATCDLTQSQAFGGQITNYGQVNDLVISLPAAAKGMNFSVILGTTVAKYFRLDPVAGDSIYLDGVTTGDGKYVGVASATISNAIQFVAVKTGIATYDWVAYSISGAWTAEA